METQEDKNQYIIGLFRDYKLRLDSPQHTVDDKALELLGSTDTVLEGAALILKRKVEGNPEREPMVAQIVAGPGLKPMDKLLLLNVVRDFERAQGKR